MNFFNRLLRNQLGMAMPMVIVIVTAAVSSIAYLMVTLIPQLQDEQKKSQDVINYKIFVSSLNDYIVHAMREKWCVNNLSYSSNILESDLLLSNDCSSNATMKQVVTFPGNLERLLWTDDTIGKDTNPEKNTIIGLNNARRADSTITPQPPIIAHDEVYLNTLKIRLSPSVLQNMSDQHPLYTMTQNIRNCLQEVMIEIKRLSGDSVGDEVKIQINIDGSISQTKLSCLQSVQTLTSTTNYTFFPRRLHTYALIKYKDLDTTQYNEYHGPVYVAGNLKLPPDSFDKTKSSIFYNSLTLGIYNDGTGSVYEAGKIKTSTGEDYTFEERGHPYLSKQDSYENFRGILGGLRLDASEDKGMMNLFVEGAVSSSDVATLEACIEENQVKTKPSYTSGTVLAYKNPSAGSSGSMSMRLGLTKKNRFKPSINAPQEFNGQADSLAKKFNLIVNSTNGTKSIADFKIDINNDNKFQFSMAPGSSADLEVDYTKYGLTSAILDPAITTLQGTITKDNYNTILPNGHLLRNSNEYSNFQIKTEIFKTACLTIATAECDDFLIPNICPAPCALDYSPLKTQMNNARDNLRNKINDVKNNVTTPAKIHFEIANFNNGSGKVIINQKDININFSSNWAFVIDLIKSTLPNDLKIEFIPYHYSYDNIKAVFLHDLSHPTNVLQLRRQDNGHDVNFNSSGWRETFDNGNIAIEDKPTDLIELDCPDGMSLADWNQDMSSSTNFSWNYANTPPGAEIEDGDHGNLTTPLYFVKTNATEGNAKSHSKSVVDSCIVPADREFIFGFYVCKTLTISPGRVKPLYMIGTFIVENLINTNTSQPVFWHNVWDTKAAGLILSKYFEDQPICTSLVGKTWKDIIANSDLKEKVKSCSAMDLVTNGPNNFSWTTVDPDIGLITGNTMTSQKVLRFQRWVIREDSRADLIR